MLLGAPVVIEDEEHVGTLILAPASLWGITHNDDSRNKGELTHLTVGALLRNKQLTYHGHSSVESQAI